MSNTGYFTTLSCGAAHYINNFSLIKYLFLTNKSFLITTFFNLKKNNFIFSKKITNFFITDNRSISKFSINKTFSVKRNFYFYFKHLNMFKNFYKMNSFWASFSFKFNHFFGFLLRQNNPKLKYISLKNLLSFKMNNFFGSTIIRDLEKNWSFLVGKSPSFYSVDLISQRTWYRRSLKFSFFKNFIFFKKGGKKNKLRSFKNTFKNTNFLKKLFINNFFYCLQLSPSYNRLKLLFKNIGFSKKKLYQRDAVFSKPLNFTNYSNNYAFHHTFANSLLISLFKKFTPFFRYAKRRLSRSSSTFTVFFRNINFFTTIRKFFYASSQRKIGFRSIFLRPLIVKTRNPFPITRRKRRVRNHLRMLNFIFSFPTAKFSKKRTWFYNILLNIFFVNRRRLRSVSHFIKKSKFRRRATRAVLFFNIKSFYSSFMNINFSSWKQIKRKRKRIKKFKTILGTPRFFNYLKKTNFSKFFYPNYWFTKKKISFSLTKKKAFYFFTNKILKTVGPFTPAQSRIFKLKLNPVLYTREKNNFRLPIFGFLYLSDAMLDINVRHFYIYTLKKILYSFAYKNELQRYILKRYTRYAYTIPHIAAESDFFKNSISDDDNFFFLKFNNHTKITPTMRSSSWFSSNYASLLSQNITNDLNWVYYNTMLDDKEANLEDISEFNIKRVRFKPGYMTLWREAREVLKTSMSLTFRYQHRLTRYLTRYSKVVKFKTFLVNEMSLLNILIKSRFLPDQHLYFFFNYGNLIYVNGANCSNLNFQIIAGDIIQLVISLKYYILYRWFSNWAIKKKIRLKKLIKKKTNLNPTLEEKKKSNSLPKWVLFSKNSFDDIAKYLEVDYFTLSSIVLYEPFSWIDINPYSIFDTRFAVINLYNWKYIN